MMRTSALLFAAIALVGCVTTDDTYDEVESTAAADGKADASSELRVRTGDTTVWMTTALLRRNGEQGAEYVLRGRASREITYGNTYIFDDVYGEFAQRGPRSFEVRWVIRSNASLVTSGVPQFESLEFTPSPNRPVHLTARTVVRPRLATFTGATSIYLTTELTPVVVGGQIVYRIAGKSSRAFTTVTAARPGAVALAAHAIDATHFAIDLTQADLDAVAGVAGALLDVTVDGTAVKHASLGLAIKSLAVTSADAYDTWPSLTCAAETQACLAALPVGTSDLSSCGDALAVRACRR